MRKQKSKGITLIALVITIILLLILTGITITILTGENSILNRANNAKIETIKASEIEKIKLAYMSVKSSKLIEADLSAVVDSELQAELNYNGTNAVATQDTENDNLINVIFNDTKHQYVIDENGNVEFVGEKEEEKPEVIEHIVGYGSDWLFDTTDNSIYRYVGDFSNLVDNTLVIPTYWKDTPESTVEYQVTKVKNNGGNILAGNKNTIPSDLKLKLLYGLEEIGDKTFRDCSNFTGDLIIPNSVTSIANEAFKNCSGFNGKLVIGDGVKTITGEAFNGCSGFTGDLVIGENVEPTMYSTAFGGCTNFTGNLMVKQKNAKVPSAGLSACKFKSLIIKDTVETIENSGFEGLTNMNGKLVIPNSVTSIGSQAFLGCSNLIGDLVIPNSVTSIGNEAFKNCSGFNGNLVIGDGVKTVEGEAFNGCSGFAGDLVIGENVEPTMYSTAFGGCTNFTGDLIVKQKKAKVPSAGLSSCKFKSIIIKDTVETIENNGFKDLSNIKGDLIIPNNVTSIGDDAFRGCAGFDGSLIIGDGVETIGLRAFRDCTGFTGDLVLGKKVNSIGNNIFEGKATGFKGELRIKSENAPRFPYYQSSDIAFANVIFEDTVKTIEENFLSGFGNITGTITISSSVESIGANAFLNCKSVTAIRVNKSENSINGAPWGWTGTVTWK